MYECGIVSVHQRRVHRAGHGLGWLLSATVPWVAGAGFLVSFTATAGTDGVARLSDQGIAGLVRQDVTPRLPRRARAAVAARVTAASLGAGTLSPGSAIWSPEQSETGFVPESVSESDALEAEGPSLEDSDGATPTTPRAVALSSVTPAPADATPIEVAAASLALPGFTLRGDHATLPVEEAPADDPRHRYADLIEPDAMDREQRCLAEAVYFEARSEPEDGQAAVAQVVLNRVKSGLYPANVCGVVYQNRHRYMGCQFSFACEGKSLRIADAAAWQGAVRIASAVIEGRTYLSEVGGATHYHADYVRPGWSRRLKRLDMIGRHIFYGLKPRQS